MTENSIFYAAIGLTVTLTLRYLNRATSRSVHSNASGQFSLRMHKLYKIMGILSLVLCLVVTLGPILTDDPDTAMYIMIFFMFLLFGGLGLLCVLYYRNHNVLFDNSMIEVQNRFGKTKITTWDKIKKVSFTPTTGLLTFIDSDGQKLKVHQHLVGISRLVGVLESKTSWKAKDLRLPMKGSNVA